MDFNFFIETIEIISDKKDMLKSKAEICPK